MCATKTWNAVSRSLRGLFVLFTIGFIVFAVGNARAEYPERVIRMVVNYAPGGATDVLARLIAERLALRLGKPIVVANVVGGGGGIGALEVARAAPDGHTLLFSTNILAVENGLRKVPRYDVSRDFAPISMVAATNIGMLVNKNLPVNTIGEFLAYAKANPGKLNYASSGVGSTGHILAAYLAELIGSEMVHIPYTGNAPALVALTGGQVQILWNDVGAAMPYVKSGNVKMLALSSRKPSVVAPPGLPTIAASGFPEFDLDFQLGILAPAGTQSDIVQRLNKEIVATLNESSFKQTLIDRGYTIIGNSASEYAVVMADEKAKWKLAIERARVPKE